MKKLLRLNSLKRWSTLALIATAFVFGEASLVAQAQQDNSVSEDTARAIKLYELGELKAAIHVLESIIELRPTDADAWYYLGLAHKAGGSFCQAAAPLDRALKLRPDHPRTMAALAFVLTDGSKMQRAEELAERALELGDRSAEVYYALADVKLQKRDYQQALDYADKALELDAKLADALHTRALALRGLGRTPEAIAALTAYIASPEADDPDLLKSTQTRWESNTAAPAPSERDPSIMTAGKMTVKARLLSKPTPEYTEKARHRCITGTVVVQMVLRPNGEVTDLQIVSGLRGGLNSEALKAARRVTFEPAMLDGKQVPQYLRIEYNFNIY